MGRLEWEEGILKKGGNSICMVVGQWQLIQGGAPLAVS